MLGQFILMNIALKPTIRSCFSKSKVISTPGFSVAISRDRILIIFRFLHIIDNESLPIYDEPQKLFKIYPLLCHLNSKFQEFYLNKQNTVINNSLKLWKGRLTFAQYITLKASHFEIKTFELCESSTGYL